MTDTYVIDAKGRPMIDKDPDAVLDYTFSWADYLSPIADVITNASIVVDTDSGVVLNTFSNDASSVTAWIKGGTAGKRARVTCRIVTAGGRTDDRSIYINIKDR